MATYHESFPEVMDEDELNQRKRKNFDNRSWQSWATKYLIETNQNTPRTGKKKRVKLERQKD